jgi:kynurenine formamidase
MADPEGLSVDSLIAALANARTYDLEQPRFQGAPTAPSHAPGFVYALHRRHEPGVSGGRTSAAGLMVAAEHFGTHIDALSHQAEEMCLHAGVEVDSAVQTSAGFTRLGAETIPLFTCRGILLDVAGYMGVDRVEEDLQITARDLGEVEEFQGSPIRRGDAVLVRTGNGAMWHDSDVYLRGAGMAADASRWLAERGVCAVGADNVAWDVPDVVDTEMGMTLPGHAILLVRHGIYILEHLYLEDLARDRTYEFVFICLPLKIRGGTASPVRPIAVCPSNRFPRYSDTPSQQ